MNKEIIVSGITPTGNLTIGNYLGAIKTFVKLQDKYNMFIFVADLHGFTLPIEPKLLRENKQNIMALYLAAGLDPKKVVIFNQSDVKAHSVLGWILLMKTTMGVLSRMTQFKDKLSKIHISNGTESIPSGLFAYPALMAADILLYNANVVPVGKDQKQHLELTQSLAKNFNNKYGKTFEVPKPLFAKHGSKIMSLTNPIEKMSKSSTNFKSYISLLDAPEIARKKIMQAKTDSENKIYISDNKHGVVNLLEIYAGFKNIDIKSAESYFANKNYKELKEEVASVVVDFLINLQKKYKKYKKQIVEISSKGAAKANKIANANLEKILNKIGL